MFNATIQFLHIRIIPLLLWMILGSFTYADEHEKQSHQQRTVGLLQKNKKNDTNYLIHDGRVLDSTSRIVGGTLANEGEFPSFVFPNWYFICGGTLIHPDIVVTAAYCVKHYINQSVSIGGIRRNLTAGSGETILVKNGFTHPKYSDNTNRNDIGIVVLSKSSKSPIQNINTNRKIPSSNDVVTTIGYGKTSENRSKIETDLRKVTINIVNYKSCKATIGKTYPVYDDMMICAGVPSGGKDSCNGDGGGPLLLINTSSSSSIQVGITSFGLGCAREGIPGVYTRISKYSKWIQQAICDNSAVPPTSCPKPPDCPCKKTMWFCRLLFRCR